MFYKDYSHWIREQFPFRVQKISVDAAFSCPNRDGRLSLGGCTFCDNKTFNPSYCDRGKSITQQLEEGKAFFAKKYPEMKYLAYFQAYSNTYAPLEELKRKYEEALAVDDVVGLVIGTRPDCVSDEALDYLQQLNQHTFLIVEYGIESANDNTLRRINRGHTFDCSRQAIIKAHQRGSSPADTSFSDCQARTKRKCFIRPQPSLSYRLTSSNSTNCKSSKAHLWPRNTRRTPSTSSQQKSM